MAIVDLVMPKLGESIMEATILKWLKQPGDTIKMDETLLEIATDKVDSEVPSTAAGIVDEILYNVNDVVPIGTVIAKIKTNAEEGEAVSYEPRAASGRQKKKSRRSSDEQRATCQSPEVSKINGRFYSPLVLNIAASEGVSMTELEKIPGTGNEGRVTKKDILQYVSERKSGSRKPVRGLRSTGFEPARSCYHQRIHPARSSQFTARSSRLTAHSYLLRQCRDH